MPKCRKAPPFVLPAQRGAARGPHVMRPFRSLSKVIPLLQGAIEQPHPPNAAMPFGMITRVAETVRRGGSSPRRVSHRIATKRRAS